MVAIEGLASSRVRLKIVDMISSRPATLGELSSLTGISVQGVLKHLRRIAEEGILREEGMKGGRYLKQRKLYSVRNHRVTDYSEDDLLLAAIASSSLGPFQRPKEPFDELDWLAQDIIILRKRARDLSHRLKRVLDEVSEDEAGIEALLNEIPLEPDEKQIAYLIFTEDTPERPRRILQEHYGCADAEAAIKEVMMKIRRVGS